jgi:hypothetical protein
MGTRYFFRYPILDFSDCLPVCFFPHENDGFFVGKGEYNAIFFHFLFRYFFLYPIVSGYRKSKFGGPIFDLPILLKSDISILLSVSDKYRISEDR